MQWYESEVRALERRLGERPNGDRPPVFYGSSSIRLWESLAEDIDARVLNLGFGGSTLEACDYFFHRLIPPARPCSLLIYAGDNDLGDGRSPEDAFASYQAMVKKLLAAVGPIPFGFVSVKPSPSRSNLMGRIRRLNEMVRADIASVPSGYFVDVFTPMLAAGGEIPDPLLFHSDGLHLSRAGYRLWAKVLEPYRDRIFMESK